MGSTGIFGASRASSTSWVFSLTFCPLALLLLFLVRGVFAPLLRVRSISSVTLRLLGKEWTEETNRHTFPNPVGPPSQIRRDRPHSFPGRWCSAPHVRLNSTQTVVQNRCHQLSFPGWVINESRRVDAEWWR